MVMRIKLTGEGTRRVLGRRWTFHTQTVMLDESTPATEEMESATTEGALLLPALSADQGGTGTLSAYAFHSKSTEVQPLKPITLPKSFTG